MANIANLLTEHMDIWTAAESEKKSGRGRAGANTGSVYGVKKLRELILGLAISGKLLPQNKNDISTQEAAKKIGLKRKLLKESLLREFQLPETWEWFCVSDLCELKTGATPSTSVSSYYGGNIRWLVSGDIHANEIFDCEGRITELGLANSNCKVLPKNSILIALNGQGKTRATVAMLRCEAACNQSLVAMVAKYQSLILPEFIWLNLKYRYTEIRDITGQKQRRGLNMGLVGDLVVSVPPLAEQHRIVAKVDELMALCDQLEQQHSNVQEAHETLVSQLLATLTQSQDAPEFNDNWQRIYAHFDVLFTTEVSIDTLKQTLLQLAVMGKLVPQDPNDEPASELLKRIQAEKAKLIAEGKIKKEKPLKPISGDERSFELPESWVWSRLAELGNTQTGTTPSKSDLNAFGNDVPFIKPGDIYPNYVDYENEGLSKEGALHGRVAETGSLLMVCIGTIGKCNIIERDCSFNQQINSITPYQLDSKYLLIAARSNYFQNECWSNSSSTTLPILNKGKWEQIVLPIPPLVEQHRIVAKVDTLMTLCDQLKTRIQQANQQQQAIADALVTQAVKPTAEIIDLADYRAATACYAIKRMQDKPYFGRTVAVKILYLAEAYLGIPLKFQPMREAAGPLDKWIYAFEKQGEHEGWFKVIEPDAGKTKVEYQVKPAIAQKSALIEKTCSADQLKEFNRLLDLFADKTTEEAEIIATLFAAWNDFLNDGNTPSDDEIVKEVRENWHESKARFTPTQLKDSLNWMRRNYLVPRGRSPRTVYQQQLLN